MGKGIRAVLVTLFTIGMLSGAMRVQAAGNDGDTGAGMLYGQPQAEYAAPHYGTRDEILSRSAFARHVAEMTAFWQETVEVLASSTYGHNVQVTNYGSIASLGLYYESTGSGVILTEDDNFVYVVTAEHCLKRENTIVEFADGSRHSGMIVYRNPAKDVGFVLVNKAELSADTLQVISPAAGADAMAVGKVAGDVLFVLTSADVPNGKVYAGILDQYSVVYPNNPVQNVMQFLSEVSYGSSGGAVYTAEGIWVGCVSGGDTFGTCWAVPYSDIMNEFQTWLAELAQQQSETVAA